MEYQDQSEDDLKTESIRFWSDFAEFMGFPRSMGEVYGHLFISQSPLCADDIVQRTQFSRSGSGQHIKQLMEIGAIRVSQAIQDRKTHYELQTDLGILIRRLGQSRIFPKLAELNQQRLQLQKQAQNAHSSHLTERFEKLDRWQQKIEPLSNLFKSLI